MLTNLMASNAGTWIFMGVLILAFVGMYFMSYQRRKKEAERAKEKMNSLVVGTVIKTIGLIEGEIVEVYENDLLIKSGESTLKIDKRAIYQIISTPTVKEPFTEESQEEIEKSAEVATEPTEEVVEESAQTQEKIEE